VLVVWPTQEAPARKVDLAFLVGAKSRSSLVKRVTIVSLEEGCGHGFLFELEYTADVLDIVEKEVADR
jgi:hypothetical protein